MYLRHARSLLALVVASAPHSVDAIAAASGATADHPTKNNERHQEQQTSAAPQGTTNQELPRQLQRNFRRDVIRRGLSQQNKVGGNGGVDNSGGGNKDSHERLRQMAHALQMVRNRRRKRRALQEAQQQADQTAPMDQAAHDEAKTEVDASSSKDAKKPPTTPSPIKRAVGNRIASSPECRPALPAVATPPSSESELTTGSSVDIAALEQEEADGQDVDVLTYNGNDDKSCDPTYYDCVPSDTSTLGGHCLQTRKASPSSHSHSQLSLPTTERNLQGCPDGCPVDICECYAYDETTSGISCNEALVNACRDGSYITSCAEFADELEAANQKAYCDTYVCLQDKGILDTMSDDGFCNYEQPECVDCYCSLYSGMCTHFQGPCAKPEYAEDYTCTYIADVCDIADCCQCNSGEVCITGYGYDAEPCDDVVPPGADTDKEVPDIAPVEDTQAPTDGPDEDDEAPAPAPVVAPTVDRPPPTMVAPTTTREDPPPPPPPDDTTAGLPDDCTMMIPDDAGIPVDPSGECWTSTVAIGIRELLITLGIFPQWTVDMRRCYKICAEQTIAIGVQVPDSIPPIYNGGDYPLPLFNPNVYIQCGESGSSSENCVLSGGTDQFTTLFDKELLNQFIVFLPILLPDLPPLGNLPDDFVPDTSNLVVKGLTFENAIGHTNPDSAFNAISAAVNLSSPGANMIFTDCIWRNSDELNPPSAAISITYHESVQTPGSPYAELTIKDSTFESGTYVRAAAMTNIDVTDYGAGAANDGFHFNIEDCLFQDNTIVEDQLVRILHVTMGSILSSCFVNNVIGSKSLISADTGSSMVYSNLYGDDNSAPAWTCSDLGIEDYSLGVAHYATTIDDVGDGTVQVTINDCPDEGFIFDAAECPLGARDVVAPTPAPPPTTGTPPVTVDPPPTTGTGDCQVCPDGSALTTPTRFSSRFGTTCQDLQARAAAFTDGSAECTNAQVISVLDCDCPYVPPADNPSDVPCTLCPDNFVPIPDLPINPNDGSSTCGVFEWQARSFQGQQCRAMQATAGAACGCANPPTAPCEVICSKDVGSNSTTSSFDIKKSLTDAVVGDVVWKGQWLCGEILWAESVDPNACSEKVKQDLRMQCCPDEVVETPAPRPTQPPSAAISLEARTVVWTLSSLALGFGLLFL